MKPQNAAASETEPQKVSKGKDEPMVGHSNSDPKTSTKAKVKDASESLPAGSHKQELRKAMKPQNAAASETEPQKVSKGKDEPMVCHSNSDPKTPMKAKDDNASKAKDVNLEEKN